MEEARPAAHTRGAHVGVAAVGHGPVEEESDRVESRPLRPAHRHGIAVRARHEGDVLGIAAVPARPDHRMNQDQHAVIAAEDEDRLLQHLHDRAHRAVDEAAVLVNILGEPDAHAGLEDHGPAARAAIARHAVHAAAAPSVREILGDPALVDLGGALVGDRQEGQCLPRGRLPALRCSDGSVQVRGQEAAVEEAPQFRPRRLLLADLDQEVEHHLVVAARRFVLSQLDVLQGSDLHLPLQSRLQRRFATDGLQLLEVSDEAHEGTRRHLRQRNADLSPDFRILLADLVKYDEIVMAQAAGRNVLLVAAPGDPEGRMDRLDDDVVVGRQLLLVRLDQRAHRTRDQDVAALSGSFHGSMDHDFGLARARPARHHQVARVHGDVRVAHGDSRVDAVDDGLLIRRPFPLRQFQRALGRPFLDAEPRLFGLDHQVEARADAQVERLQAIGLQAPQEQVPVHGSEEPLEHDRIVAMPLQGAHRIPMLGVPGRDVRLEAGFLDTGVVQRRSEVLRAFRIMRTTVAASTSRAVLLQEVVDFCR